MMLLYVKGKGYEAACSEFPELGDFLHPPNVAKSFDESDTAQEVPDLRLVLCISPKGS